MDDPGLSWPAWKFGMKRADLFTTLHDKYNTFSFTLQDPEAFHHDVYELSHYADTAEDFHQLLADRRQQRLDELHHSLRSLAVEIIANPKLMASDQWQHALQLFRTKSFDSVVRFFASYLPDEYLDRQDDYQYDSAFDSVSEPDSTYTQSTKASSVDDAPSCHLYLDTDFLPHDPVMTNEKPCPQRHNVDACPVTAQDIDAPLSPPESEPMLGADAASSPTDVESQGYPSTGPPSRSMSFSGSESDMGVGLIRRALKQDDEVSQSSACDTAATSVSDPAECRSCDSFDCRQLACGAEEDEDEEYFQATQFPDDDLDFMQYPDDTLDSETPTPRPQREPVSTSSISKLDAMASYRFPSHHLSSPSPKSARALRREGSPLTSTRRSPEEALSKIQKPMSDSGRKRPKGRI